MAIYMVCDDCGHVPSSRFLQHLELEPFLARHRTNGARLRRSSIDAGVVLDIVERQVASCA